MSAPVTYDFAVCIPADRLRDMTDFCPADKVVFYSYRDERFWERWAETTNGPDGDFLSEGEGQLSFIVSTHDQQFAALFRLLWSDFATVLLSEEEVNARLTKRIAVAGLMTHQMYAGVAASLNGMATRAPQAASYLQQLAHHMSLVSVGPTFTNGAIGIGIGIGIDMASNGGAQ